MKDEQEKTLVERADITPHLEIRRNPDPGVPQMQPATNVFEAETEAETLTERCIA